MRVLAITQIFPNAIEPLSAPFNRQQFSELGKLCQLEVLATIPWFPDATLLGDKTSAGRLLAAAPGRWLMSCLASVPRLTWKAWVQSGCAERVGGAAGMCKHTTIPRSGGAVVNHVTKIVFDTAAAPTVHAAAAGVFPIPIGSDGNVTGVACGNAAKPGAEA